MTSQFTYEDVYKPLVQQYNEEKARRECWWKTVGFWVSVCLSYAGISLLVSSVSFILRFIFSGEEEWEDIAIAAVTTSSISYTTSSMLTCCCYSTIHHYHIFKKIIISQIIIFVISPLAHSFCMYRLYGPNQAVVSSEISGIVSLIAVMPLGALLCLAKHCKHIKNDKFRSQL